MADFKAIFLLMFYAFSIISSVPLKSELNEELDYLRICNATSPIALRVLNEAIIEKRTTKTGTNVNFKCFLHCLYALYGWMDEDGGFLLTNMRRALEATMLHRLDLEYILYHCTDSASVDMCERAFLFTQCFWTRTKENEENYPENHRGADEDVFIYKLKSDEENTVQQT